MKRLYLRHVDAVGMHHHGPRQLSLHEAYTISHEIDNKYDPNAIVILYKGDRAAYIKRDHAKVLADIFRAKIPHGTVYLIPKLAAKVITYDLGPQHDCSVGFFCDDSEIANVHKIVNGCNIVIEIL